MGKTKPIQTDAPKVRKPKHTKHYIKSIALIAETAMRVLAGFYIANAYSTTLAIVVASYFVLTGGAIVVAQYVVKGK